MSERTYSEIMNDFRQHVGANEIVATDTEDVYAIEAEIDKRFADLLDAAHKREVEALKQRCAELNAEVAAKDEVIKRLNDAISEEQRRRWQLLKKSSAVGNAAKLREAMTQMLLILYDAGNKFSYPIACGMCKAYARKALAAPPRNCEVGTAEEQAERWYWRYHVGHLCQSCPLGPRKWSEVDAGTLCFAEWLQKPCKEGGDK